MCVCVCVCVLETEIVNGHTIQSATYIACLGEYGFSSSSVDIESNIVHSQGKLLYK